MLITLILGESRETIFIVSSKISSIFAFQVDLVPDDCNSGNCTLLLTGYLRAHGLSVNQLVIF